MSNSTTTIALVEDDHAGELLTLRRAAFVTEAQLYDDPNIPPLTQTLTELREDLARDDVVTIGAWEGHRMIGSVRVEIEDEKAASTWLLMIPSHEAPKPGNSTRSTSSQVMSAKTTTVAKKANTPRMAVTAKRVSVGIFSLHDVPENP
jgi:hypothetical protein